MPATIENLVTDGAGSCHSRCLMCGHLNPRSLNLSFRAAEDGTVTARFKPGGDLQGYDGILHGGVVASLLDAAMTHCLFHRGIQAVTGDLHVRFLGPVSCGAFLDIRARVLVSHPPLYRLEAELLLGEHVMARAEGKFMRRSEVR